MLCPILAILVFPVVAATVISNRIFRYLKQNGYAYATAGRVTAFVVSFAAIFFLALYIISTKFRFGRF
jgi:hypothetical protein